jgi:hypothetical protein
MGKRRALFEELDGERNSSETRAFPDVRWMEIKQIDFLGESLDLASVLRWRNRILWDG